jgi:hypothetical protein
MGGGDAGGRNVVEGARRPLFGVLRFDFAFGVGMPPVLFLVLVTGSAGSAAVGGPCDDRGGLGSAVAIVTFAREKFRLADWGFEGPGTRRMRP